MSEAELVVGAVVETHPDRADAVAARLGELDWVEIVGDADGRRLAVVLTSADGSDLERRIEGLISGDEDLLGIFPTYVGQDEPEGS